MRASSLSVLGSVLGLLVSGVHSQGDIVCYTRPSQTGLSEVEVSKLFQDTIQGPLSELCNTKYEAGPNHEGISDDDDDDEVVFSITGTDANAVLPKDCNAPFQGIVKQCTINGKFQGGTAHVSDLLYEVHYNELLKKSPTPVRRSRSNANVARAKKPGTKTPGTKTPSGKPSKTSPKPAAKSPGSKPSRPSPSACKRKGKKGGKKGTKA